MWVGGGGCHPQVNSGHCVECMVWVFGVPSAIPGVTPGQTETKGPIMVGGGGGESHHCGCCVSNLCPRMV